MQTMSSFATTTEKELTAAVTRNLAAKNMKRELLKKSASGRYTRTRACVYIYTYMQTMSSFATTTEKELTAAVTRNLAAAAEV